MYFLLLSINSLYVVGASSSVLLSASVCELQRASRSTEEARPSLAATPRLELDARTSADCAEKP